MGKSPLQCACASPYMDPRQNKEMVVFILKAGANPNYTNKGGYTAMDIAKWVGKQGFQRIGQAPVRG